MTGCPDCDKTLSKFPYILCPKHELEQLKWRAESAKTKYEEAKAKYDERKQNELATRKE